jgi:excisionase family DNA binding protein
MTHDTERWLTREQAAQRAGVHVRTIDNMLRDGTLTRYKRRGSRRVEISADQLDAATTRHPAAGAARSARFEFGESG